MIKFQLLLTVHFLWTARGEKLILLQILNFYKYHLSPPPPRPVSDERSSGRGYSVQYQYRPATTDEEDEDSIVGEVEDTKVNNNIQIPVVDSEDESTFTQPKIALDAENPTKAVGDEGYRNCMKNVFLNIADAQQTERSTEDVSITLEDSAVPSNLKRDVKYKADTEAEPESQESELAFIDSEFTLSREDLGLGERFEPKLVILLGSEGPKERVVTALLAANSRVRPLLDIGPLIEKHIK